MCVYVCVLYRGASCLFHTQTCAQQERYGWNLRRLGRALRLDILSSIRLVNFLRRSVAERRASFPGPFCVHQVS